MMYTLSLRKVGGSVMLAVPPALLVMLGLKAGGKVAIEVQDGRLIAEPLRRPRYTLEELLARCDSKAPRSEDEREWLDDRPVGSELI